MSAETFQNSDQYYKIIDTLSDQLEKAANTNPNIDFFKQLILQAKKTKEDLDILLKHAKFYNQTVERIQAIQKQYNGTYTTKKGETRYHLDYPFNTQSSAAALDRAVGIEQQLTAANKIQQLRTDTEFIYKFHTLLQKKAIQGYTTIMQLRKILTNQEIIYAIQTTRGEKRYQTYVNEEQFINILSSKPQYNASTQLRKFTEQIDGTFNFKSFSLQTDFNKIESQLISTEQEKLEKAYLVRSRDPIYAAISQYIVGYSDKGKAKKLRTSAAWEAYTDARAIFGAGEDISISEDKFKEFMGKWLMARQATFQKRTSSGIDTASLSTLPFYQGGDTSTKSKYVAVQNKSVNSWMEAGVRVQTIYNALIYINQIFSKTQINATEVKQLFTATELKGAVFEVFDSANTFAQEQIDKNVHFLNLHLQL